MGKNNKTVNSALWAMKNPGKAKEMEERFGVNVRQGAGWKSGSGESYEEYQESSNWHNKMTDAARNDYDLRRTLEAAAMSGKGKADKILKKGFNNLDDVAKAMNFSEKAAKRHGQGGDFSSNSDYMGLTRSMVQRDRAKQTAAYDETYAKTTDLNDLKDKLMSEATEKAAGSAPIEPSDRMAAAEDRLEKAAGGTGNKPPSLFDKDNAAPSKADDQADAARNFLDDYTADVKQGANIKSDIETGVSNAARHVRDTYGR